FHIPIDCSGSAKMVFRLSFLASPGKRAKSFLVMELSSTPKLALVGTHSCRHATISPLLNQIMKLELADKRNQLTDEQCRVTRATVLKAFAIIAVATFVLRIFYARYLYED